MCSIGNGNCKCHMSNLNLTSKYSISIYTDSSGPQSCHFSWMTALNIFITPPEGVLSNHKGHFAMVDSGYFDMVQVHRASHLNATFTCD